MTNENMATGMAYLRFLVAEDNEFQRRMLVRMLSGLGAQYITEAGDGRQALEASRNHAGPVHIGIIDLDMPGMDGMELIRHLAAEQHVDAIILASALDRPLVASVEVMARAYGVNLLGTLEKPAGRDRLRALVDSYRPARGTSPASVSAPPGVTLDEILQGLRDGQFEPFFQPKVDLSTRLVKGVEALARWRHPKHGGIPPSAFIPVLEEGGQLAQLTSIIFDSSVAALRAWRERGLRLQVSVNLSLTSVTDDRLLERMTEHAAACGIEPRQVVFEVTESVAISDLPHCLENLARLRMKGFGLSIDDYGTGYSSLQQLLRIPFTELKIDRSFVSGAACDAAMRSVLGSSIELCRKLGLRSVAEGVETADDWEVLRELGCDMGQGYFVARPMPQGMVADWVEAWQPGGAVTRGRQQAGY